jgi:hypothetical protein
MRAREILDEDYDQNLESTLGNILISAKAAGNTEINTNKLAGMLTQSGYSVNVNNLMLLLSRNPAVLNATPTTITLTEPEGAEGAGGGDPAQDSAAHVSDMAQKATNIK